MLRSSLVQIKLLTRWRQQPPPHCSVCSHIRSTR